MEMLQNNKIDCFHGFSAEFFQTKKSGNISVAGNINITLL